MYLGHRQRAHLSVLRSSWCYGALRLQAGVVICIGELNCRKSSTRTHSQSSVTNFQASVMYHVTKIVAIVVVAVASVFPWMKASSAVSSAWWKPTPGTTWEWQLSDAPPLNDLYQVKMYDIDLDEEDAIKYLKRKGYIVICYFSAGTWEPGRDDSKKFNSRALGNKLKDWPKERWLDIRRDDVRELMKKRLDKARDRDCDGVEPDNVDGYSNNNGFGLSSSHQLNYNIWLATEAHRRRLSVGLKNDVDQIRSLERYFDWALNEECVDYDECDKYKPFLDNNKAVFHTEYVDRTSQGSSKQRSVCKKIPSGFSTLIKEWDLTHWRKTC